jgi:uncharacterized protein (TIGR03083 family)
VDNARFLSCLEADYRRIREVAPGHLDSSVPTCPDWTVADLVRHVAQVYLHKVEMMRHGRQPEVWPPAEFEAGDPVALLDRSYAALRDEFAERAPSDSCATWYEPDQTVGFWIRRMAQETVIHRIDAELGAGAPVARVPGDLAADGVDELLQIFVGWAFTMWPEDFTAALEHSPRRTYLIRAEPAAESPQVSWIVRTAPDSLTIETLGTETDAVLTPDVTVSGSPAAVLRWAWNREAVDGASAPIGQGSGVTIDGDAEALAELRACVVEATQ